MRHLRGIVAIASFLLAGCLDQERGSAGTSDTAPATSPEARTKPPPLDRDLAIAFRLIESRRTGEARSALGIYCKAHPEEGRAEFLLGLSYHREKRYRLARSHFERAVELAPDYHPTYHFMGWCLYYLGQTELSRPAFEKHLEFVPTEGDSHFALGLLDLDDDRLDDAEARFRKAIELQEGDPRRRGDVSKAHARLADVFIRRDDLAGARAHLETATALWPEHYAAFYKLSRVLTRLGDEDGAGEADRLYRLWQARAHPPRGVPEPGG